MKTSDSLTKIAPALREAQKNIDHVEKTSTNPHFGNTYTDLNAFLRAVRDPLSDVGIMMTQSPGMQDGWVTVETLLHHDSGEWIKATAGAPMQKDDPQGVGSAITYLRRYSLATLLAIPQEGDDGNAASRNRSNGQRNVNRQTGEIDGPACPKCEGPLWDNREKKESGEFSAKSPDFKCRDKEGCGWTIWLDSTRDKLVERITTAHSNGLIDAEERATNVEAVEAAAEDGDIAMLGSIAGWVRSVETVKTGKEAEQGSLV